MIVGFTGTKRGQTPRQRAATRALFAKLGVTVLHHGDCVGSDAEADYDARRLGATIVIHPPNDDELRAFCDWSMPHEIRDLKPYLERNHDIVNEGVDGLIATPKEMDEVLRSGTWSTIRYAHKVGRRLLIIYPDGTYDYEGEAYRLVDRGWLEE